MGLSIVDHRAEVVGAQCAPHPVGIKLLAFKQGSNPAFQQMVQCLSDALAHARHHSRVALTRVVCTAALKRAKPWREHDVDGQLLRRRREKLEACEAALVPRRLVARAAELTKGVRELERRDVVRDAAARGLVQTRTVAVFILVWLLEARGRYREAARPDDGVLKQRAPVLRAQLGVTPPEDALHRRGGRVMVGVALTQFEQSLTQYSEAARCVICFAEGRVLLRDVEQRAHAAAVVLHQRSFFAQLAEALPPVQRQHIGHAHDKDNRVRATTVALWAAACAAAADGGTADG
eukprot:6178325-Pleurochrysis_carterae.AAC.4